MPLIHGIDHHFITERWSPGHRDRAVFPAFNFSTSRLIAWPMRPQVIAVRAAHGRRRRGLLRRVDGRRDGGGGHRRRGGGCGGGGGGGGADLHGRRGRLGARRGDLAGPSARRGRVPCPCSRPGASKGARRGGP